MGNFDSEGLLKILNLESFIVEKQLLIPGEKLYSAVANGIFAFFGTFTSPGKVIKIDMQSFSYEGIRDLEVGENYLSFGMIFGSNSFFVTYTSPSKIVKVSIDPFERVEAESFDDEDTFLNVGISQDNIAFVGRNNEAGSIIKVQLDSMEVVERVPRMSINI